MSNMMERAEVQQAKIGSVNKKEEESLTTQVSRNRCLASVSCKLLIVPAYRHLIAAG